MPEIEEAGIVSGFQPEYRATVRGETVTSASLFDLIKRGASTEIDFPALNVFLRTGFYVGTRTAFRDIRFQDMPPLASLGIKHTDLRGDALIDAYIDLFRQAVQRQIQQNNGRHVCMGLSGGRDSRHILLELCRAGAPPELCWTVATPHAPTEASIAESLAGRKQVPHKILPAVAGVGSEHYKNRATSLESIEHCWITGAIPVIQQYQAIYDGIAGDVLSAGHFLTEERVRLAEEGRYDELVEKTIVQGGPIPLVKDQTLFPPKDAVEQIVAEFVRHLSMPDPVSSFYLWNRTRRAVGASAFRLLCPNGQRVCTPYLDFDLFRWLSGLSARVTVGHELHTNTIRRAFPDEADVPFAEKTKTPHIARQNRKLAVETIRYLSSNRSPLLDKKGALLRLTRALTLPSHLNDAAWLHTFSLYLTQVGTADPMLF